MQSPGLVPTKGNIEQREHAFNTFMMKSNCSDLKCLREAPTSILIAANSNVTQINGSGPVVDDDIVPDYPSKLMLDGRYHKTLVSVIAANNNHEVAFWLQLIKLLLTIIIGAIFFTISSECN